METDLLPELARNRSMTPEAALGALRVHEPACPCSVELRQATQATPGDRAARRTMSFLPPVPADDAAAEGTAARPTTYIYTSDIRNK